MIPSFDSIKMSIRSSKINKFEKKIDFEKKSKEEEEAFQKIIELFNNCNLLMKKMIKNYYQ